MAVRNFWLSADVDGRSTQLEGGPRSKEGGFDQTVYIRNEGGIETGLRMAGQALRDGSLVLEVRPGPGMTVEQLPEGGFKITSKR